MRNPHTSRRTFIRTVGLGLAAAPLYVPARAFGANDRIRLGFIGVGKMGMGHVKSFAGMKDVEIRAVADVEESRRQQAQKVVGEKYITEKRAAAEVSLYVDYREMLAKNEIDAVVIATPDHWHTTPLVHAALAKKDVYCEKPLTLTLEESELSIKAVRKMNIVLQTGSQQRSENDGRFRVAAAYIRAGKIGKVTAVSGHFGPTSKSCDLPEEPMDPGLDWDRWLGQAAKRPYHTFLCRRGSPDSYPWMPGWRDYSEFSGGQVTDWGCHHLDIVQWALGKDGSGPNRITPPQGNWKKGGGGQLIYDKTIVGDNIVVTHRAYGNGIRFYGTDGEIWVNRDELVGIGSVFKEKLSDAELNFDGHLGPEAMIDWSGTEKGKPPKITGTNHRREFLDRIRDRKDPVCKIEVGAGTAAVCHLLNLAYWGNKPLQWNAAKWSGVAANQKGRKARAGYELPKV